VDLTEEEVNGLKWLKSQRSKANGDCLEEAATGRGVAVRDSKNTGGVVLHFSLEAITAFHAGVKRGAFDRLAA
jgi:hypothetical protein